MRHADVLGTRKGEDVEVRHADVLGERKGEDVEVRHAVHVHCYRLILFLFLVNVH